MTKLSVNINKVATIRNARGGNTPNLVQFAIDCEHFGADGITVHPRPDERHITYRDIEELSEVVQTEFNIEGYPDDRYLQMIKKFRPHQATLVPDPPGVLTSNAGWNFEKDADFLIPIIAQIRDLGVRVSLFVEAEEKAIESALNTGTDRIELYTGPYAAQYPLNKNKAVAAYQLAAQRAKELGLGINAGHDLSFENLHYFKSQLIQLDEVSIGHAIISEALYLGMENCIQLYKNELLR